MEKQFETRIEKVERLRKEKKAAWKREIEARELRDRIGMELATKSYGDADLSAALADAKDAVRRAQAEYNSLAAEFDRATTAR